MNYHVYIDLVKKEILLSDEWISKKHLNENQVLFGRFSANSKEELIKVLYKFINYNYCNHYIAMKNALNKNYSEYQI